MISKKFLLNAWEIIDLFVCIRDEYPGAVTEEVKNAARALIEYELQYFKTEKFCIAICCELEFEIQREAAWFLVSEMLNGKFSWITGLSSLSVEKALIKAGIISESYFSSEEVRKKVFRCFEYAFESSELPKSVIEKFNLPTHRLHPDKSLTEDEKIERRLFNASYSCGVGNCSVL